MLKSEIQESTLSSIQKEINKATDNKLTVQLDLMLSFCKIKKNQLTLYYLLVHLL